MKKITIETELTQAQIADIMGVKQPQVSNWLNGKRLPTSQNLVKLANILNYYPEELLNDLKKEKSQDLSLCRIHLTTFASSNGAITYGTHLRIDTRCT